DGSAGSEHAKAWALELATAAKSKTWIITVGPSTPSSGFTSGMGWAAAGQMLQEQVADAKTVSEKAANEFRKRKLDVATLMPAGSTAAEIVAACKAIEAD